MYLDQTPSHYRYAAYQTGYSPEVADDLQSRNDVLREMIEREYGLKQDEISSRLQSARISAGASTSNARTAANASMSNAKLAAKVEREKLALAREEMERIGIPDMEIRRFVAEKNYEIARLTFGLDVIRTATEYNSTPDQRFQAADFEQLVRAGVGEGGILTAPTSRPQGQPTPNSLEDLVARLTGGFGASGSTVGGSPDSSGQQQGMIPTSQAAQAVINANPPSPFQGLSESDASALKTIQAMYSQGLDFRNLDQMSPTQLGHTVSGGKRLGFDPTLEAWRAETKRPVQGSARGV